MGSEARPKKLLYGAEMCMYDLMREAHNDDTALAVLNEGLLGTAYTCRAFGCDVMKSMQGGSPITYSECIQGNEAASPPLSIAYLNDVVPLEDDGSSFD